jgi:hypothetical protein
MPIFLVRSILAVDGDRPQIQFGAMVMAPWRESRQTLTAPARDVRHQDVATDVDLGSCTATIRWASVAMLEGAVGSA